MSKRTEQIAALLQQSINEILIRDFEAPHHTMISASQVTVAPDLKNATVYVSIIPENHLGSGLEAIKKFSGHVQRELNKKMIIKNIPQLHWELDERAIKYDQIDQALGKK